MGEPAYQASILWILEASGRRAALQHHPTADSGHADGFSNGWRTVGGMWTGNVSSYITPTLPLGPELPWFLTEDLLEIRILRNFRLE